VAGCIRSGLTAAQVNTSILTSPAGQYNALGGGNPDLNPETAKTYTAGLVLTPLRNLSATLDYFDIKVDDVIGTVPANLALSQCVFSGQFCDLLHRDPRTGALWVQGGFVTATNVNTGSLKTSGLDLSVNYNYNVGKYGGLGFAFNGTYTDKFVVEPLPGLGTYDCAGFYGATCGTPIPKWRHKFRTIWSAPWNFDMALTWRHMDSVKVDSSSGDALLATSFDKTGSVLGDRDYMDISVTYNFWKNWAFRFGINNIFDRDPPLCDTTNVCGPPFGNGNTYPQVYDSLGRKFFTGLTVNF
jgi:outer membrane receptor protein involved in Fe transport